MHSHKTTHSLKVCDTGFSIVVYQHYAGHCIVQSISASICSTLEVGLLPSFGDWMLLYWQFSYHFYFKINGDNCDQAWTLLNTEANMLSLGHQGGPRMTAVIILHVNQPCSIWLHLLYIYSNIGSNLTRWDLRF
jgi:hypothetical protein